MNIDEILKEIRKWLPKSLLDIVECVISMCTTDEKDRKQETSKLHRRGDEIDKKFDSLKREVSQGCDKTVDLLQNIIQELRIAQLMKRFDEDVLLEIKTSLEELSRIVNSYAHEVTMTQKAIDYLLPKIEKEKKLLEEKKSENISQFVSVSSLFASSALLLQSTLRTVIESPSSVLFLQPLLETATFSPVSPLLGGGLIVAAIMSYLALYLVKIEELGSISEDLVFLKNKLDHLFGEAVKTQVTYESITASLEKYLKSFEKALRFSDTLRAERVEIMTLDMINETKKLQEEFLRLSLAG